MENSNQYVDDLVALLEDTNWQMNNLLEIVKTIQDCEEARNILIDEVAKLNHRLFTITKKAD